MLSGKNRSDVNGCTTHAVGSDHTEETVSRSKVGFFDRAKVTGQRLAERVFLRPRRNLAQRAGVAVTSGMLLITVLLHPWAGATPAQAAAVPSPAPSSQATTATVSQNQGQVQLASFTVDAPAAQDHSGPTPDISTPEKFIAAVAPAAQDSQRETHVPAAVTISQAILESEWGRSGLSTTAQNYFGIKSASGPGPAGVVSMSTWEVFNGQNVTIQDGFKAYHNLYESVMDHGRFLAGNPRYADAFQTSDPKLFTQRMHKAGYATDPDYSTKVSYLIDRYHLDQYDLN